MATPILGLSDATVLFTSIGENLIANLPFILAVVGFGIVATLVLRKINDPFSERQHYDGNYKKALAGMSKKGYTKNWTDNEWDMFEQDERWDK